MVYAQVSQNSYLIRLEKGEEIIACLKQFCQKNKIKNASLVAVGSIENPTLAHYRVDTKKYSEKSENMRVFGGHLVSAVVHATLEVVVTVFNSVFTKSYDKETGLKLFDLSKQC